MELMSVDGAGAFVLLLLPGAISLQVYRMILPGRPISWSELLPQALFYSLLNFGALFPIVGFLLNGGNLQDHPILYWFALVLTLIVAPVGWPLLYRYLLEWDVFRHQIQLPYPTAWDFHFSRRHPAFVLATLNDGSRVGGYYGPNSYATSFPEDGDLYLERAVVVNEEGNFGELVAESRGILLRKDQYRLLEFFEVPGYGGNDVAA